MQIEYIPLEQLGFVGRGKSKHRPRNDESLYGGDYPFIQTADVKKAELYIREYSQTYNEKGLAQSKLWPKGTLCLTIAANIADTAILDMEACFPDSIIGFIADETKVNVKYVKYFYSLFQRNLQKISQGAAQDNLNLEKLLMYPIPCPWLDVQNRIVGVLGTIDDLLVCNSDLIDHHKLMVEKLYHEWFINFKFPNHEQVEFVDGMPEGWAKKTIFACYEILSGGTPKTTNPLYWENGKIPFFTPKDATDSYFVNETEKYITEDGLSKCNSKLYDEKTIFITARGTVGKTAIPMRPMAMNQSCYALKPKADLCFYYSFLNIEDAINKIKQNANGGVFDAIVVDTFKQIDVLVPQMEIQVQFENLVEPMFEQIKNLLKQNEHLLELKNTLLPRLMSGELDVSKLSSIE